MPVLRYLENCGKLCEQQNYMADLLGLVGAICVDQTSLHPEEARNKGTIN